MAKTTGFTIQCHFRPFGILQHVHILYGLSPSSLLTEKSVNLMAACDGFLYKTEIISIHICKVTTLIAELLFKQFLIHTDWKQVEHSWQQSVMDTSLFRRYLISWDMHYLRCSLYGFTNHDNYFQIVNKLVY